MKIAFLHYHLRPGGVTTVMRQQAQLINDRCETLTITGESPRAPWPTETARVPGIAYDGVVPSDRSPDDVAEAVCRAISARWKSGCDLVHVHNPLLKKNRHFIGILKALQARKLTLFLQVHDFAEDGRPGSYFMEPYPADCHYGVINSRDYRMLQRAGLHSRGLHKIANAVRRIPPAAAAQKTQRVVYPIRAIRRKNVGEALLLALFLTKGAEVGITLPPSSPTDMLAYGGWKRFAKAHRLPVAFDIGLAGDFARLIASAFFLVSTSISEGFGFTFLEPWTAEKLLWGRDLPEITSDFKMLGVKLDHLYPALNAPLSNGQKSRLWQSWKASVADTCARFGLPFAPEEARAAFGEMTAGDRVDFGLLNESFQKEIIRRALDEPKYRLSLLNANPFLVSPGRVSNEKPLIENNRQVVQNCFDESAYRERLIGIYEKVCNEPVVQTIDKQALLFSFFDLKRFSLLKWGGYAE